MKKLLFLCLGLILAIPGFAVDFSYTYEGQTLNYTIISEVDKTCKTKDGSYNYQVNNVTGAVKIPAKANYNGAEYTVTEIGTYTFSGCTNLTSVELTDNIQTIGNYTFYRCAGLKECQMEAKVFRGFSNRTSGP